MLLGTVNLYAPIKPTPSVIVLGQPIQHQGCSELDLLGGANGGAGPDGPDLKQTGQRFAGPRVCRGSGSCGEWIFL